VLSAFFTRTLSRCLEQFSAGEFGLASDPLSVYAVNMIANEQFSADERQILAAYFSNVNRPVFALVNLPEVVKGALFARYSRSAKSLRRLFLDEFFEKGLLPKNQAPDVGLPRAERLYDKILTDYGDDSVAQLGNLCTSVAIWV
jgi:hypothetical protein